MTKPQVGELVYRVREYDELQASPSLDGGPDTWIIDHCRVENVHKDGTIILRRGFLNDNKQHSPHAFGVSFFRSPKEALDAFMKRQNERLETAQRHVAIAVRAKLWAAEQRSKIAQE